ncbi:hypothetical protein CFN78_13020 [Amycolatopsis antarctica]|uniref:Uncharacterized protein n=1 Tax=Amycolatopsis antarctica TaxID=1854586 RepID=A0A263D4M8_9PSEU|nr:hypothetical protein CFN78_13020 [Amycolatopsis antarctica]
MASPAALSVAAEAFESALACCPRVGESLGLLMALLNDWVAVACACSAAASSCFSFSSAARRSFSIDAASFCTA